MSTATEARSNPLAQIDWDYVEFYVGNAKQAAHYYMSAFGFDQVAYAGPETGVPDRVSYLLEQNKLRFVLTASLLPDDEIARHVALHGDGIKDIAILVQDARAAFEMAVRGGDQELDTSNEHGFRRLDAGSFERRILPRLTDLQIECSRTVDDTPSVSGEPGEHARSKLGRISVVAGVRRRAHPVVKDALRRLRGQIKSTAIEKPVAPWQPLGVKRTGQWLQPG